MSKRIPQNILLTAGEVIKDTYTVDCFVGAGAFAEVYRVKHKFLGLQALKVLKPDVFKREEQSNFISEATILSHITHPNVVRVFEANSFKKDGKELFFISMEYVSGETLFQMLKRKIRIVLPLALSLQRDICAGLSIAHRQEPPVIHRDIKPQNILLSYDTSTPIGKVSDFGVAKAVNPKTRMTDAAGTVTYLPPEGSWGFHTPASDVFSAGIVFYQMVTGIAPWTYDFTGVEDDIDTMETAVLKARKQKPQKPSFINDQCDSQLDEIILKAIEDDQSQRFKDGTEFLGALLDYENRKKRPIVQKTGMREPESIKEIKKGSGFSGVAGMDELKELLYSEIILPLQQKDLYDKYRISLPNGILLYGPPGCGKTFISTKLSEEINYTFIEVKPSDLASTYVHGTQQKIGRLFRRAREKVPSIIFIDEIDAMIPKRSDKLDHHYSSEVNEFLSQLGECSREGIVVIATTNRPDRIDSAALRTGRFDKLIYVPPPDYDARVALFDMFLSGRPTSSDIKTNALASATENYVASDIEMIVNEAARSALKKKGDITFKILSDTISTISPSVSREMIEYYNNFKNKRSF
ncbi:AAA family ATPase [candidate division WOR-3 bacterium]|nr:AAA family ATPase [candidate division WOR-3 bacterium]